MKQSTNNSKDTIVALIGQPNTGKTSLFNCLSKKNYHVGNWPGVTVEKKETTITINEHTYNIVDLPGTYSVTPYTNEEKVAYDFLIDDNVEVVIQIIDVNTLERNLLMTFELLALKKKVILAFNFNEEALKRGVEIKIDEIRKLLQIPIITIEANQKIDKDFLFMQVEEVNSQKYQYPTFINKMLGQDRSIDRRKAMQFIKKEVNQFYSTKHQNGITEKIDSILLNTYTAFPIFFIVMAFIFQATYLISTPIQSLIESFFNLLSSLIQTSALPPILISFLNDGVINGLGSVLVFIPIIFILFFLISLMEDTGYLSRTIILVDTFFRKFGISGQTFVPMILGFGCNVPAIMAIRSIKNRKERLIATFINPFMSCSARLPVYVLFTSIFFPHHGALIIMFLYSFGVVTAFITSFILSKLIQDTTCSTLLVEMPPYRIPSGKSAFKNAWSQTSSFIKKAGTTIFMAIIFVWGLASFPIGVTYSSSESFLGQLGQFITPLFKPLGFGHWSFSVALIFGVIAKEIIIATLGTIHHGVGTENLSAVLTSYISNAGALSFLFFVLLYLPCIPALTVIKKETGKNSFLIAQLATTFIFAWIFSFGVYHLSKFLGV